MKRAVRARRALHEINRWQSEWLSEYFCCPPPQPPSTSIPLFGSRWSVSGWLRCLVPPNNNFSLADGTTSPDLPLFTGSRSAFLSVSLSRSLIISPLRHRAFYLSERFANCVALLLFFLSFFPRRVYEKGVFSEIENSCSIYPPHLFWLSAPIQSRFCSSLFVYLCPAVLLMVVGGTRALGSEREHY